MIVEKSKTSPLIGRRQALGLLAAFAVAWDVKAAEPRRIAAIDWAMLETLMALGVTPIAATELIQFRSGAVEPEIPQSVVDLGLRGSPNFELLHLLRPELILISPFYVRHRPALVAIAPVFSLPFYIQGEPPYAKALAAVSALGTLLGRADEATKVLAEQAAMLERFRQQLSPFSARPTYIINVGDSRHFRAFGADSMFGDIMQRLGLPNAWTDRSRFTFAAPVPMENLAANPDARIVIVSDIPVEARSSLRDSMIWKSLKPVQQGRVVNIGNVNPYGGITAGLRFARLLSEALTKGGETL
jgi:ABC-type Fe3+-hydroxamate transport system substrate-binding protein